MEFRCWLVIKSLIIIILFVSTFGIYFFSTFGKDAVTRMRGDILVERNKRFIDDADRVTILAKHNELRRSQLGSNMRYVVSVVT